MSPNLVWADKATHLVRVLDDSLDTFSVGAGAELHLQPAATGGEAIEVWELDGSLHACNQLESGLGWCQMWLPFRSGRISYSISPSQRAGLVHVGWIEQGDMPDKKEVPRST